MAIYCIYKHDRVTELGNIANKSCKWLEGDSNEEQQIVKASRWVLGHAVSTGYNP